MKKIYMLFLLFSIIGCARTPAPKVVYFNVDERVICDSAKTGVCLQFAYDCCVLSRGSIWTITGITPEPGKAFRIIYE